MDRLSLGEERQAEGGGIAERLAAAEPVAQIGEMARRWFHQVIVVRLERPRQHDDLMTILNRVRGAWGEGLKRSASADSISGRPCSFDPPSAFDIFFREQLRLGGRHGIPKPYVLAGTLARREIEIRLSVFGFACDWIEAARERLVEALAHNVRWTDDQHLPTGARIRDVSMLTAPYVEIPPQPAAVELVFDTPFDATGTAIGDEPSTIVGRLARRVGGMARWMDMDVDAPLRDSSDAWRHCEYYSPGIEHRSARRGSRRQRRAFENPTGIGRILIEGDIAQFWPILVVGQTCHVGRGAVAGYGRYWLEAG